MKKNLLSGTFWLSSANLLCKILGIVYLIPWLMMMGSQDAGQQAQALYNVAYLPYALFLTLGTAGFPSGIAKKIAAEKDDTPKVQLFFRDYGRNRDCFGGNDVHFCASIEPHQSS